MVKLIKSSIKSAVKGIRNDPEIRKVINRFPRFFNFVKKRLTPDEKFGLYLTVGLLFVAIFMYLFLELLIGLFTRDILVMSDLRVINIAKSFRTPGLNEYMFFMTTLGSEPVIMVGAIATAAFFYFKRYWHFTVSILLSTMLGEVFYRLLKYAIERNRPPLSLALIKANGYSFPSGHAFMAMVFFGMLAYFVIREARKKIPKYLIILFFAFLIINIGYSRIYFGVHWPTDVLAGLAVGAAWITVFITALEIRRKFKRTSFLWVTKQWSRKYIGLVGVTLILIWGLFFAFFWNREKETSFLKNAYSHENKINISKEDIPDKLFENLPKVSETISGKPQEPIHIILVGEENQLKTAFIEAGWLECDRLNARNLKRQAIASLFNQPYPKGPGVPSLWNTVPNDLAFEKPTETNSARERHHIHFWETPFLLEGKTVWFATSHYDKTVQLKAAIMPIHTIDPAIDKEREEIRKELFDADKVSDVVEFQLVEPTLGKNQSGDTFFTDGKTYIFYLK